MALRDNATGVANGGVYRTIPDSKPVVTVGVSEGSVELDNFNSVDLTGKWVTFRATVGTITIQRATSTPTMVAGEGFTIDVDTQEELYIDPDGELTLYHISDTAASKLYALIDSEG